MDALLRLIDGLPCMAWAHDADGTLLHANPAWRGGTALAPEAGTMPQAWARLMPPYDLVRHLATFGAALRAGEPYAFEHRLKPERAPERDYRWYVTRAVPVGPAAGAAWLGTTVALPDPGPHAGAHEPHADAFERAVLAPLPRVAGVRLDAAGASTAGDQATAAGGGWYDAFALPDGRLVLAVGDVAGCGGVESGDAGGGSRDAMAVAALRGTIRGAALAQPAPDAVLAVAHAALALDAPRRPATALVALYDPLTRLLCYASAGHPPGLLHAGGTVTELAGQPRLPLGSQESSAAELRTVRLPPGAVALWYAGEPTESTEPTERGDGEGRRRLRRALADPALRSAPRPAAAIRAAAAERTGRAGDMVILVLALDLDGPGQA